MGMSAITATATAQGIAGVVRAKFAERRDPKKKLAEILGYSLPTAYGRINGQTDWLTDDIEKVARYLGITPQRIFELAQEADTPADEVERTLPVDPWENTSRKRGA